ncbi:MAG TPA: inositol monophosphatase family protein [Acidimicrobiales bacterium]|nr:inositol monophosphatase family protein [Acidimicrobiales bacterium]
MESGVLPPRRLPSESDLCAPRTSARAWVLLLLHDRPAHGYEIIVRLAELGFRSPPGRIYRALKWLEKAGLVDPAWEFEGRGPARRVYTARADAAWTLEVIAPTVRSAADALDEPEATRVLALLERLVREARSFTFMVRAQIVVDATTERIARRKIDRLFGAPHVIDIDVLTTGDVQVGELVDPAGSAAGTAVQAAHGEPTFVPGMLANHRGGAAHAVLGLGTLPDADQRSAWAVRDFVGRNQPTGRGVGAISDRPGRRTVLATLDDHKEATRAATEAGHLLVELRRRLESDGASPEVVRRQGDRLANDLLVELLCTRFPDDGILSEEAADDATRLELRRVWIIDPLDGTREFGEPGRTDWAVHVALVVDCSVAAGAVALPAQGLTLSTMPPPERRPRHDGAPRMVVSRSRPAAFVEPLADRLGATLVPMGSAGAKAMAVVLGEAEIFVHAGGQYEWDTAAPVAVAAAAGLHVSRIDGSPLRYNNAVPWLPDVLVCTKELAEQALGALSDLAEAAGQEAAAPGKGRR